RDLAQDAAHDLAGAGLGQSRREVDEVRRCDGADFGADMRPQFRLQRRAAVHAGNQGDVAVNPLTLDIVRIADHGGLGDEIVAYQRAFDLGRAHAVAGDVDDIVHPSGDPVIAVRVAAAAVAG